MKNFYYSLQVTCLLILFFLLSTKGALAQMSYTFDLAIPAIAPEKPALVRGVHRPAGQKAKPSDHLFDYGGFFSDDIRTSAANADLKNSRIWIVTTSDYNSRSAVDIIDEWQMGSADAFTAIHFEKQSNGGYKAYYTLKLGTGLAEKFTDHITNAIWEEAVKPALTAGNLKQVSENLAEIFRTEESAFFCLECWDYKHVRAASTFLDHLLTFNPFSRLDGSHLFPSKAIISVYSYLLKGNYTIEIKKDFHPDGNIQEYCDFLYQSGVDYFTAYLIQYSGLECCARKAGHLDKDLERNPPVIATLTADILMATPGAFYGWFTGKHWRTDEELSTFEQLLAVLDVIPGEAFVKIGITKILGARGVHLRDYSRIIRVGIKFSHIDEFWASIPASFRNAVKEAFVPGTAQLKYADKDMILYRHISKDENVISFWMTDQIFPPQKAREVLALPNSNTAEWIAEIRVKKGTPYVEGKVASQVGKEGFGSYAVGGGYQFYFLKEYVENIEYIEIIKPIYLNSK